MLTGIGQDTVRELRAGRPPGVTEDAPCAGCLATGRVSAAGGPLAAWAPAFSLPLDLLGEEWGDLFPSHGLLALC